MKKKSKRETASFENPIRTSTWRHLKYGRLAYGFLPGDLVSRCTIKFILAIGILKT